MRSELLDTVNSHVVASEAVLLFGDSSLSGETNEIILKAVHRYIRQTLRLSHDD